MNQGHDIKKIWQEASRKIEENNSLSRSKIQQAIESKSKDIISQFVREKKTALISGLIFIPLFIIGLVYSFPINLYSILFIVLLVVSAILALLEGLKHLKKIRELDESGSLQESLSGKLSYLTKNFRRGQFLSPLLGVGIYLPMMFLYWKLEYGSIEFGRLEWLTIGISLALIIGITSLIIQFQKYKYLKPLQECLNELENLEDPSPNRRPRINIGLVLTVLLLLNLVLYLLAKFL